MKSNKLLCRILAKREILLQVAQVFDILRISGLKSEQEYIIIVCRREYCFPQRVNWQYGCDENELQL